jgi:hypothetical protein
MAAPDRVRRPRRLDSKRHAGIIYLFCQNAYPAQKWGRRSAVSHRAFHLSGFRSPELDAYPGWLDCSLHCVRLDHPRSDLMVQSGRHAKSRQPNFPDDSIWKRRAPIDAPAGRPSRRSTAIPREQPYPAAPPGSGLGLQKIIRRLLPYINLTRTLAFTPPGPCLMI